MNRRNFIQTLMAGAAVVMLPALAKAVPVTGEVTTVSELLAWMEDRFHCRGMEPKAFVEHKIEDVPKLYGFSVEGNMPPEDYAHGAVRFTPIIMSYACEGDDPVAAEARLVQVLQEKFAELDAKTPLLWRVRPAFDVHHMTEYGDTWMTSEQVEDRADLQKEITREKNGKWVTYTQFMPNTPLQIPEGVEVDWNTGHLKYVKRRYTLNKVRLRLALPTVPSDYVDAIETPESSRPRKI